MATNVLDIPTNVGPSSYSGLGSAYQNFSSDTVLNMLKSYLGNYSTNVNNAYADASSGLSNLTKSTITPAIQSTINNLAGKNILNSSVAGDTLSKTISNLTSGLLDNQATLANNKATALTSGYSNLLTDVAGLGNYSTSSDNSTAYKIMASLLQSMM